MRYCCVLVVLAACTEPVTAASRQPVEGDSCDLLPEAQDVASWRGESLFPAVTRRAVTLTADMPGGQFAAYGVDVDAARVVFVVVGPQADRDSFIARSESINHDRGLIDTIAGKVGCCAGNDPPPVGDPRGISPVFLVGTATAMADAAFRHPIACE